MNSFCAVGLYPLQRDNFLRINNIDRVHNGKPRKKRGLI
jgi:hypothetical protein